MMAGRSLSESQQAAAQGLSSVQRALLRDGIDEIGLTIDAAGLRAIEAYLDQVQKWRNRINLVSISNERELITHHALDSLVLQPMLTGSARVLDIGTGAGFPGMLLAAASHHTHFTLLDSRQRRIEFLRMLKARLALENVELVCARVETLNERKLQSGMQVETNFDTLIARAVASLSELVNMTTSLRIPGQRLIAMKGQYPKDEITELTKTAGDSIVSVSVEPLAVPYLEASRHAVVIEF